MNQALVFVQRATKTAIHLLIIPFGWFGGVLVALVIACSRLAVRGDNQKKAHDERGLDRKKRNLYQTPLVARRPPIFQSFPLTESLEQVTDVAWLA